MIIGLKLKKNKYKKKSNFIDTMTNKQNKNRHPWSRTKPSTPEQMNPIQSENTAIPKHFIAPILEMRALLWSLKKFVPFIQEHNFADNTTQSRSRETSYRNLVSDIIKEIQKCDAGDQVDQESFNEKLDRMIEELAKPEQDEEKQIHKNMTIMALRSFCTF